VFHEADSYGYKSDNGTWNGIIAMVISGVADIGVIDVTVTKERTEVVLFTDTIRFER
jgi:ABC-type amino acid transport substrate-binding protein